MGYSTLAQKKYEFKVLSEKQIKKQGWDYEEYSTPVKPISFEEDELVAFFEVLGGDPEANNKDKERTILKMDECIKSLSFLKENSQIQTIILKVSEGTFIKEEDGLEYGTKAYNKKATKINAKRFEEHYSKFFNENFAGKKIVYLNWGW